MQPDPKENGHEADIPVYAEVLRRYWNDATFHAEVKTAEMFVERDLHRRSSEARRLTSEEAALVRMGAAVALVRRDLDGE